MPPLQITIRIKNPQIQNMLNEVATNLAKGDKKKSMNQSVNHILTQFYKMKRIMEMPKAESEIQPTMQKKFGLHPEFDKVRKR